MLNTTRRTFLGGAAIASLPVVAAAEHPKPFDLQEWLNTAPVDAVVLYHAGQLAAAMNRADPTRAYRSHVNHEHGFVLVVGDRREA